MRLVIGRIGKAHGVRGELNVSVHTDDPEDRFAIGAVIDTDPAERGPLTVTKMRYASDRLVVGFKEIPDRDTAEKFSGTLLVVDTNELPEIDDDDEYYDHELVGMRVVEVDDTLVGVVIDVVHGTGGDTLVVKSAKFGTRKEFLIPFVRAIVPTVDRSERLIVIDPPEGLLEL